MFPFFLRIVVFKKIIVFVKMLSISCQARRNEKISGGGATNYDTLLSTIVARRKKFSVSNRLQRLEELNISRKQVM